MTHKLLNRTELFKLFDSPWTGALNMKEFINSVSLILDDELVYTKADLEASEPPDRITAVFLFGLTAAGDGNAAIYKRVDVEPGHANKIQSADGQWWERVQIFGDSTTFIYDVAKYGATLKGVIDDTAAIVAAAADLRAAGGGTLWFPPGSKCLVSDAAHAGYTADGDRAVLLFNESGIDVHIQGNGTEIIFAGADRTDYASFINVDATGENSKVEVSGFTYRFQNPPTVTGVVTEITAGVSIKVDLDQVPLFTDVQRVNRWEDKLVDSVAVLAWSGSTWGVQNALTLDAGTIYIVDLSTGTSDVTNLVVGDEVTLEHHLFGAHFLKVQDGGDIIAHDNTIINGAGSPFRILGARHVSIYDNREIAAAGLRLRRTHSSDGCHISGVQSVSVRDNYIEGTGDDLMNVTSKLTNVTVRVSDTQLTCGRQFPLIAPVAGRLIQLIDAARTTIFETHIVSVDAISATEFTITVADTMPAGVDATWEFVFLVEDAQIVGNFLAYGRGRGILASARALSIADNRIVRPSEGGILIESHAVVHTGIKSLDISGNALDRCNTNVNGNHPSGVIQLNARSDATTRIAGIAYENVAINGNSIGNTSNSGIVATCSKNLEVVNNRLALIGQDPTGLDGFSGGIAVTLDFCDLVLIEGNSHSGATPTKMEAQDSTNVKVGDNPNIVPSTVANVFPYTVPQGSRPSGVISETADAVTSYAYGVDGVAVIDTTVYTVDRFRQLLKAGNQVPGDIFYYAHKGSVANAIIRDANSSTTIKTIVPGNWGSFIWNGTAWALLAHGTL